MRLLSLVLLSFLAACGGGSATSERAPDQAPPVEAPSVPHTVVVYATASLRPAFTALAARYEQDHSGAEVELHFAGGAALLAQAHAGAVIDVVAIGDSSQMSRFAAAALLAAHSATELARNRIAIAVAKGNPKQVHTVRDLVRADVRLGLGTRSSSIGRYGRWVLTHQNLDKEPSAEAPTADALLAKLAAGEVDAAIVYVTTLRGVDGIVRVDVPAAENQAVLYSIAAMRKAAEPRGAAAFRALALSPTGQAILQEHGLLPIGAK
ncbi:MAG: extracellular solute-binding protein [Planctomycetes bacterium]|nr:extracellular solute-binding protein [Planctomycetota bacterium]